MIMQHRSLRSRAVLLLPVLPLSMLLLLVSCSRDPLQGRPPLSDSTFVSVMVDLHLVDADLALGSTPGAEGLPAVPSTARDSVLTAHGATTAEFEETITWWAARPEQFLKLYENVLEQINRMSM